MPKTFINKFKHYANLTFVCIVAVILYGFSLLWIFQSVESLINLFSSKQEVFKLDRNTFIGFPIVLLFTSLAIHIYTKKVAPDKVTEKHNNIMSKIIFISILLVFLPFTIEFLYDYKLSSEGYYVCEAATDRWLYLKTTYYTNSEQACFDLVSAEN